MAGRSFFDSNILVYTDDAQASAKQESALALWQAQRSEGLAVVSIQVLQEYFWSVTRKLGVDSSIATEKLMLFAKAGVMSPLADDVVSAARLAVEHKLPFWDAMIVQMALRADCDVLFSEDMQAGRRFAGLKIVNPFVLP
ncbi:PIN domain-containing protein [Wenzhouxiangella sp. C33]|uniref:PIN domain-containing protein n=2 Tax=Wenzhouxiangella limi TaxID=2707351 RepID=A0A845UX89_9GAMM|nr:PIN domain-containing protein [Wenzhouxiangella limi]